MISLPLPASWLTKKALLRASGFTAVVAAFLVFGMGNTPSYVQNGIPVPFIQNDSVLQGKVTFFSKRNNIDVYEVTFKDGEVEETLMPDNIYLVHIPNDPTITASPIDLVMSLAGTFSHDVDYYGYRYSDAAATFERRDIVATRFKDRFPGQFFASAKARASDASHGNALATFEAQNDVVFRPTDNATGGVRIDPAGSLYVIIANEPNGIDMNPRSLMVCGDGVVTGSEECDDRNTENSDECTNQCTHGLPIPFGSGSTATGATQTDVPLDPGVDESGSRCSGTPIVCTSFNAYVKELADTNNNDVVSDNEALMLTLNVAEAPDQPYSTVNQYDMDQDGDTDNTDVGIILTELDILAP
ncbi:MAG: DUF4215 domain-containing protein [Candidatus Peribacteraceae bacterium]|nr:DUF4215 domain-containing protein [Candidatus Peribacteraceae bacterium]